MQKIVFRYVSIAIFFIILIPSFFVIGQPIDNQEHKTEFKSLKFSNNIFPFPKNLKRGDLLFYDLNPILTLFEPTIDGYSNDHVMMYIGENSFGRPHFIESIDYTSIDLNHHINGVQVTPWIMIYLISKHDTITIGKVAANQCQKEHAIDFAISKIGDHYQWAWPDNWRYESWHANPAITNTSNAFYEKYYSPEDPYINQWTCAELVWAAYINQGIQLDYHPFSRPDPDYENQEYHFVGTHHLRHSENISLVDPLWN